MARGVPIAEVARNVDSAVRYGVHRALDRDIDELAIHVDRLRTPVSRPVGDPQPRTAAGNEPTTAESGADDPAIEAPTGEAGPEAA